MADEKGTNSQTTQGRGPLGQSGVSPSGTVQRNYQTEFVGRTDRTPSDAFGKWLSSGEGTGEPGMK